MLQILLRHQQTVLDLQEGLQVLLNFTEPAYGLATSQNALACESLKRTRVYRIFTGFYVIRTG